jgi:DNA-binding MarR family transcriptional regulator
MNRFSFSVRRVHRRWAQLGILMTRSYGLTPARFDLMHAISCQRQAWLPRKDLRELLGVRGPTVSRMVMALVRRGFLEVRRDPEDGRRRQIRITRFGRMALGCAFTHLVKSGYMHDVTARAVSAAEDFTPALPEEADECLEKAMTLLEKLKSNLGDMSRFQHGDDGLRPAAIEHPIFEPDHDEWGNWPGEDPPVYFWIAENLPLPRVA